VSGFSRTSLALRAPSAETTGITMATALAAMTTRGEGFDVNHSQSNVDRGTVTKNGRI